MNKIFNRIKSIFTINYWYHPIYDTWFPRCNLCKGFRDIKCPKDCLGDC